MHAFYRGLLPSTKAVLDTAAGGSFSKKYNHEAYSLLEDMVDSIVNWNSKRLNHKRPSGVFGVDAVVTLSAQLEAMNKKIEALAVAQTIVIKCELCRGPHTYNNCLQSNFSNSITENANYVSDNFRNNQMGNTYNLGLRNHPNLSWRSQNIQNPPPP